MSNILTDRLRMVMRLANQHGQKVCHDFTGTEDIFVGMIMESKGITAKILMDEFNVTLKKVEYVAAEISERGPEQVNARFLPLTQNAKNLIKAAQEEAECIPHPYVGTEHLTLALLSDRPFIKETKAFRIIQRLEIPQQKWKDRLFEELAAEPYNAGKRFTH